MLDYSRNSKNATQIIIKDCPVLYSTYHIVKTANIIAGNKEISEDKKEAIDNQKIDYKSEKVKKKLAKYIGINSEFIKSIGYYHRKREGINIEFMPKDNKEIYNKIKDCELKLKDNKDVVYNAFSQKCDNNKIYLFISFKNSKELFDFIDKSIVKDGQNKAEFASKARKSKEYNEEEEDFLNKMVEDIKNDEEINADDLIPSESPKNAKDPVNYIKSLLQSAIKDNIKNLSKGRNG